MTSRRSSGSMRTESVVEPTRSANITVTWRRSAVSWVFGSDTATGIEEGASGAAVRAAIASSSFLRWPSDATPMSLRSSFVSRPSSSPSMSLARKISAYWARPIPRRQPSMSNFSPHLGSCQRQFSKKVESLAPTVIPRGFLNQLGFAMWTPTTRQKHSRTVTRYQTDLTDTEWRVIAPHLPKPCATGRPREWPMREIVNGIFYVMRAGCPWRLVPSDLPPWETIYRWFAAWRDDGRFERINHALVMADRERVGRAASPSAAIIDSQSVKTTEAGGPRGYDAGKKINGRKRHALVDTDGRGLVIEPHPASIQDRDGGGPLLSLSRRHSPSSSASSPMRATLASASPAPPRSPSRSCARPPIKSASPSSRDAGLSSASSPGSGATGDWRRTSKPQ